VAVNDRRLTKVRYRAPGAANWEEKDWNWAVRRIAELIKQTREATFVATDAKGQLVNRAEGIACLGGDALDNEECYAYSKFARALGVVYVEHQARI
jgi:formate dehydrogenase major subunit